jgi:hypothetical protein
MRGVLCVLLFCATSVAAQTFRVTGTVTSAGSPVAGVRVQLGPATVTTSTDGRFAAELPPSNIDVVVDGVAGFLPTQLSGVPIDRDTELRLVLQRAVRITGRITGGDVGGLEPIRAHSLTREFETRLGVAPNGEFTLDLPPDAYALHGVARFPRLRMGRANVDARGGNVSGIEIALETIGNDPMQLAPPIASRISVSNADAEGMATVAGAAGATEGLSAVAIANLFTTQFVTTVSNRDGSFSARIFAPPGAVLQIKHDPTGHFIPKTVQANNALEGAAGTLVYVPAAAGTFSTMSVIGTALRGLPPSVAAAIGHEATFRLHATGAMTKRELAPGESIAFSGTLALHGATPIGDPSALLGRGGGQFHRYFDAQGRERRIDNDFVSGILTPTGLPIGQIAPRPGAGVATVGAFARVGAHLEAPFTFTGRVPDDLPPGHYRIELFFNVDGLPRLARSFDEPATVFTVSEMRPPSLPVVRIGNPAPPRLAWVLGLDDFSNGTRGTIAMEDRGSFAIANHIATNSDTFILPKGRYRLEPFAPMLSRSAGNGALAEVPHVPLKFPSGSLKVSVTKPDGTIDDLGTAPFAQAIMKTPITRAGNTANGASFHVSDFLQLSTLEPRFDYEFTRYGLHRISMTGMIEDLDGNVYAGGGVYELWIAKTLDLETAVLPGTPFEVHDAFAPAVVVQPGVPAYVEIDFRLSGEQAIERSFRGWANRFGLFASSDLLRMPFAGEYRVDVTARFLDDDGVLWMGAATFGGVVATPSSPLVTRGRRGFDLADGPQPQWFRVPEERKGGDHVMFPFNSGDIMWMSKFDPAADIPKITVTDPVGSFAARMRARASYTRIEQPFDIEDRITAGEIPLFSSSPPGRSPVEPESLDRWGYFYAAASRPGVRVRELISGDHSASGYWRFTGDNYAFQPGTGITGDLPNDFKFQFGGAVYRDESDGFRHYSGYASLFVLLPDDDRVGRVFPPFDASGGPILKLKGKDIDLFFHPTALRPGSILIRGEPIPLAGYAAPTLRSRIDAELIAPSGRQRGISGYTNAFGYFHQPLPFTADESGVWRMKVRITNEGPTSAGSLQPPYPTGDVLGSRDGEMYFYVVDPESPAANVNFPSSPALNQPVVFDVSGLSNRSLTYTVAAAGFILEEGTSASAKYTYDLAKLAETFPNLDRFDPDGRFAVDTVTLSFFLSGRDANGSSVFRARQVLLQGEELLAPAQNPPSPATRRRAVR